MKTLMTKYIPATNTRGSRIRVSDGDRFTKFYPYDHSASCAHIAALKRAKKLWIDGDDPMIVGNYKYGKIAVFANDEVI